MGAQKKQRWTTQEKKDHNKKNEVNPSDQEKNQKSLAQSNQGGLKTERVTNDVSKPLQYNQDLQTGNERLGGMQGEASMKND